MRRGGIATCYLTIWHLWPLRHEIRVINGPLPSHVLKAFPVGRLNFQKWNPDAFLDHVWKSDFVRYRFCFPQSHHMLPIAKSSEWTPTQDPPPFCTSPNESVSSDTKYHLYFSQRSRTVLPTSSSRFPSFNNEKSKTVSKEASVYFGFSFEIPPSTVQPKRKYAFSNFVRKQSIL